MCYYCTVKRKRFKFKKLRNITKRKIKFYALNSVETNPYITSQRDCHANVNLQARNQKISIWEVFYFDHVKHFPQLFING